MDERSFLILLRTTHLFLSFLQACRCLLVYNNSGTNFRSHAKSTVASDNCPFVRPRLCADLVHYRPLCLSVRVRTSFSYGQGCPITYDISGKTVESCCNGRYDIAEGKRGSSLGLPKDCRKCYWGSFSGRRARLWFTQLIRGRTRSENLLRDA